MYQHPYWKEIFHVRVDMSSVTLGTILVKLCEGDIDHANHIFQPQAF